MNPPVTASPAPPDNVRERSVRGRLRLVLGILITVPAGLGVLVMVAGLTAQSASASLLDVVMPASTMALTLSDQSKSLSDLLKQLPQTRDEIGVIRRSADEVLTKIERTFSQVPRENLELLSGVSETATPLDDIVRIRDEMTKMFDLADERVQVVDEIVEKTTEAKRLTVDAQTILRPEVNLLMDGEENASPLRRVQIFGEIEDLIELSSYLRTLFVSFGVVSAAQDPSALKTAQAALMLEVRGAVRLSARVSRTRENVPLVTSRLFELASSETGLAALKSKSFEIEAAYGGRRETVLGLTRGLVRSTDSIFDESELLVAEVRDAADFYQRLTLFALLAMILSSIGVGVFALRLVDRSIVRPLSRLADDTAALAEGNLEIEIAQPDTVELAKVAVALKRFGDNARSLQQSNADLEQFASVASHDLQSPLREVSNFLGLLRMREKDRLDEKSLHFIQRSIDGAQRMQVLIEDLLMFSMAGQDRKKSFDLNEILEILRSEHGLSKDELVWDDLPKIEGIQIDRLLANVVGNAVKFSGDRRPKIVVVATDSAKAWTIVVRDHGIGIAPEHREKVFKLFQRLHRRAEFEGQGIGLAVCKRICERNGGDIEIVDTPQSEGATFAMTLAK